MISFDEYQVIQESFGLTSLGLGRHNVIGGPIGSQFQEMGPPMDDEELEDDDENMEDDDDMEDDDAEGEELGDEEGMGDMGDEDLAGAMGGLEDEEGIEAIEDDGEEGGEFPPEDADEEMSGDEEGLGGDEMGGLEGGEGGDDEIADLIAQLDPALMGDEMGGELGGDEEAGADVPVDDAEVMGDEEGLEGELGDEEGLEDGLGDEMEPGLEGGEEEVSMGQMLNMMKDMMKVYMRDEMGKGMDKDSAVAPAADPMAYDDMAVAKEETEAEWLGSLVQGAQRKPVMEDALFKPAGVDAFYDDEPEAGQAGFAPQGRIGGIGGGYEASDFADIPTLGESKQEELPTIREYMEWKSNYRKQSKQKSRKR